MSKVLVSNGNIGSAAAASLAKQGHTVNLLVRKPEGNADLKSLGISFSIADAAKPETLAKAFEGAEAFFFVSPLIENMVELAANLIEAAKNSGVKLIVRSSANGANADAPVIMGKLHGQVEEMIKNSRIGYTILQPASFFQNIFGSIATIKSQQAFYGSAGEGKNAWVDVKDIAAVAATVITEGAKHSGKTYVVTGPEAISNYDVAKMLSEKLGVEIKYVNLSPEELGKAYKRYGMSGWTVNALLELDNITKLGYVANVSDDIKNITGKQPIAFTEFLNDNLSAFR